MPNPTDIPRLRALLAGAKMPPRLFAISRHRESWPGIKTYEVDTGGEQNWFCLCLTKERADVTEAVLNAAPALLDELEALREKVQMTVDYNTALRAERDRLRAERDAAQAEATGLREALERIDAESQCHSPQMSGKVFWRLRGSSATSDAIQCVKDALARTPAQHRGRIVAQGLREMAEKVKAMMEAGASTYAAARNTALADVVIALSKEADRLERGECSRLKCFKCGEWADVADWEAKTLEVRR